MKIVKAITLSTKEVLIISSMSELELSEAMCRLAAFESIYAELADSITAIPSGLEQLRAAGKEKTVRYKELFGQKLMINHIIALFQRHGITFGNST